MAVFALLSGLVQGRQQSAFQLEETTIAQIHAAFKAGSLTCRSLVEQYQQRIAAFDKKGPAINAIVVMNPDALAQAEELDGGSSRADCPDHFTASPRS